MVNQVKLNESFSLNTGETLQLLKTRAFEHRFSKFIFLVIKAFVWNLSLVKPISFKIYWTLFNIFFLDSFAIKIVSSACHCWHWVVKLHYIFVVTKLLSIVLCCTLSLCCNTTIKLFIYFLFLESHEINLDIWQKSHKCFNEQHLYNSIVSSINPR